MSQGEGQRDCPHCGAPLSSRSREQACPVCGGALGAPGPEVAPEGTAAAEQAPPEWSPGPSDADGSAAAVVCLTEECKLNPMAVGPLVEEFLGLGRGDARHHVVRCKGLVAEGLALDAARHLVEALAEEGVGAFALPLSQVPDRVEEVSVAGIYGAEADALHLDVDGQGTRKSVPWRQVVAGVCTRPEFPGRRTREVAFEGPEAVLVGMHGALYASGPNSMRVQQPAPPKLRVTLVLAGRPGEAGLLGFDEQQVRYAYLGQRVLPAQHLNFGLLLEDILTHCPHAFWPRTFRAAAGGSAVRVPKVLGKLDYDHYVRWAVCCAAARGLFPTGAAGR